MQGSPTGHLAPAVFAWGKSRNRSRPYPGIIFVPFLVERCLAVQCLVCAICSTLLVDYPGACIGISGKSEFTATTAAATAAGATATTTAATTPAKTKICLTSVACFATSGSRAKRRCRSAPACQTATWAVLGEHLRRLSRCGASFRELDLENGPSPWEI